MPLKVIVPEGVTIVAENTAFARTSLVRKTAAKCLVTVASTGTAAGQVGGSSRTHHKRLNVWFTPWVYKVP